MTALFWETITPDMRGVLSGFTKSELGARFYLAGGRSKTILFRNPNGLQTTGWPELF